METSFEKLERHWREVEKLNNELLPQLYEKAKELGVMAVRVSWNLTKR